MTTARVALLTSDDLCGQLLDGSKTGVYAIVNRRNGKRYVGSTGRSFRHRWSDHIKNLRRGTHHSRHLQSAWNNDGELTFEFIVVLTCSPADCIQHEQSFIDAWKTAQDSFGYNIRKTADSQRGTKRSAEQIARLSAAHMGIKPTAEANAKRSASLTGRPCSAETRAKISLANRGRVHSEEHRQQFATNRRGKKHSAETLEKMSASRRGKTLGPIQVARSAAARRGKSRTPEQRENMRRGRRLAKQRREAAA